MKLKYLILSILAAALGLGHANAQENEIVQTVSAQNASSTECKQLEKATETEKGFQASQSNNSSECLCAMQMAQLFPCAKKGKFYRYTCTCGCHNHPVNNYSGLNSLTARLANRLALHPNDSSLLSATWILQICGKIPGREVRENAQGRANGGAYSDLHSGVNSGAQTTSTTEIRNDASIGNGAPVYFFFKLAKAELTDPSQLLNLDAIATLAGKNGADCYSENGDAVTV